MVDRCRDVGFDLAARPVEVVPTAHYMMGGVKFNLDCSTEIPALFVAGEDLGGVHGANRLGGNGVANSTVFGGVAGDEMGPWVRADGRFADPDESHRGSRRPRPCIRFGKPEGDINEICATGCRTSCGTKSELSARRIGMARGMAGLDELKAQLDATGLADGNRARSI